MNVKKYLVTAIVLSTVLLAFAASTYRAWHAQRGANEPAAHALSGPSGKFGPEIEAILPAAKSENAPILNLETGHALLQPPCEDFNCCASTMMSWIRSNGLDISCSIWSGGAACVTYDMSLVAAEGNCWNGTTEEQLVENPALAPGRHSPRRLLVLGPDRPDTYLFRTGEGTLGMLRIVGLSQDGIKIRYKLITPAKYSLARLTRL